MTEFHYQSPLQPFIEGLSVKNGHWGIDTTAARAISTDLTRSACAMAVPRPFSRRRW